MARIAWLAVLLVWAGTVVGASAATLDTVKQRGRLICGVSQGISGFSAPDANGNWAGFDVDFCRAVAAAIFKDAGKVDYVPVSTADRFDALASGKVDILSRNSTWTMGRETGLGLTFVGVAYYDGQGFMVPRASGILSALELDGSKVCVGRATTTEANLADYFDANNMAYEAVLTASPEETLADYQSGKCDVLTSDMSQLYSLRLELDQPDEQVILPDAISKEPLGPVVREDDPKWATLVRWVHFALLDAEELGVGSDTIDAALQSKKPDVRRLVGTRRQFRRTDQPVERLGRGDGAPGRQLRRNLRPQYRRRLATRHPARHEPAVESRRNPVRAADPLKT